MIISGENFRSLAERDTLSFVADVSVSNAVGVAEIGFSGESQGMGFTFSGGRIIDPENRYVNSYIPNQTTQLSGNFATESYEYYIGGVLNCSVGEKNNFKINNFFINTDSCSADIDFYVYATPQNYKLTFASEYQPTGSLQGEIKNNSSNKFVIFSGTAVDELGAPADFILDTDTPSGSYDGKYIQDYEYKVGSGDLDECNGRLSVTPEYPNGIYHYHVTDNWPYVMACFRGRPVGGNMSAISETTSGTAPEGAPYPWSTGDFLNRQMIFPKNVNVIKPLSGVDIKYSNKNMYVVSHGIPKHNYGPFVDNPNSVSVQNHIFKIPLNPEKLNTFLPLETKDIGVAINGVPMDILSAETYKSRGNWREAVHPTGSFGLDRHNAHVQPNGKYHYHSSPLGLICENDFTTPTLQVTSVPSQYSVFTDVGFTKHVDVFGVNVFATSGTPDSKVSHAANVIAEYLDNDLDGKPDNIDVANALICNQASIVMGSGVDEAATINTTLLRSSGYHALQLLHGDETNPSSGFDVSLEETLHLLTDYGWSHAYPSVFGTFSGSQVSNYMDTGRGGHHEWCSKHSMPNGTVMNGIIHGTGQTCLSWGSVYPANTFQSGKADGRYPSGSWYHYSDETCDYSCQVAEYLYWGVTTNLGAQTGRLSEVSGAWELHTPSGLQSGDPNFYNLINNPTYKLPTGNLPTGNYSASANVTVSGETGHSPLIGYAIDGYPIYGPRGYVNTGVAGDVKTMTSSYVTKNTSRGPAYPKTIEEHNDLYIPYRVDFLNTDASSVSLNFGNPVLGITLNTNFGDINKTITVTEKSTEGSANQQGGSQGGGY